MNAAPLVTIAWALVLIAWISLTALWVGALVDAGATSIPAFTRAGSNKGATMALLLLAGWLGAVYWFAILRRRVKRSSAGPPRNA